MRTSNINARNLDAGVIFWGLAGILALFGITWVGTRTLVRAMYERRAPEFLNEIIEDAASYHLDHYYDKVDGVFIVVALVTIIPIAVGLGMLGVAWTSPKLWPRRGVVVSTEVRLFSRNDKFTCVVLGISFFVVSASLAFVLREKYLLAYGALFQSDPDKWLPALAHGNGLPTFRHPLFVPIFSSIIRGLAALIVTISPVDWQPIVVRETLVILLVPLFSGLKAAVFFALFRVMYLAFPAALLLTLIAMLSSSQVFFGSIPEHMGISGALLTLLLLQGALGIRDTRFDKLWIWALVGIATIGVTISNAAAFAIIYACVRQYHGDSIRSILLGTGVLTVALVAILTLAGMVLAPLFEYTGAYPRWESTFNFFSSGREIVSKATHYPMMLFYTLAAGDPFVYTSEFFERIGAPYATVFALEVKEMGITVVWVSLIAMITVVGGVASWFRSGDGAWILAIGAALILLLNWGLHSVWGTGWYFYSQHWHSALILILAGWLTVTVRYQPAVIGILTYILCVAIVRDVMILHDIFETMDHVIATSGERS